MKKIFLSLIVFTFAVAHGQQLSVDLVDIDGTLPFNSGSVICFPLDHQPEGYQRPTNLKFSRIRSFNFQSAQSLFWRYLSKKITKDEFLSSRNVDTTLLTTKQFENKLWILVGIDSSESTVVIPDLDDNHSFLNDTPIIFKKITDKEEQVKAKKKHPPDRWDIIILMERKLNEEKQISSLTLTSEIWSYHLVQRIRWTKVYF